MEFSITSVNGKREQILPPLLYDLTDLQKDLSIRYGFTAEQTLSLVQQLYEKKHVTYPRTDSRYLTKDMQPSISPLLEKLRVNFDAQIAPLTPQQRQLHSRYFNDAKVTDHHAIIPTTTLPKSLVLMKAKPMKPLFIVLLPRFIRRVLNNSPRC